MKIFINCLIVLIFLLFLFGFPSIGLADTERLPLTLDLLDERINNLQLQEGISTIDLSHCIIDLTEDNREFRDEFYQKLQTRLNRSSQPIGLDFSDSLIQGKLLASPLGLTAILAQGALPQILTEIEQKQLEKDERFLTKSEGVVTSVTILRGGVKLSGALITGDVDFSQTIFLQSLEAKGTSFTQGGNWNQIRFHRKTDFTEAVFEDNVNFNYSKFLSVAKFEKARFKNNAQFMRIRFQEEANFNQVEFSNVANFMGTLWSKNSTFSKSNWRDRAIFSNNIFLQSAIFNNATFEKSVVFRSTSFSGLVDLQSVKLLEKMDFGNAEFLKDSVINVGGLAFYSEGAKILGDTGKLGRVMSVETLDGNETVLRNLVHNFRDLEQIPDANQLEYKTKKFQIKQLEDQILIPYLKEIFQVNYLKKVCLWFVLNLLLWLSNYGTNFGLILGVGVISIGYFGLLFWLVDRWRRNIPSPIIPDSYDTTCMLISFGVLLLIGIINIFNSSENPIITLMCLGIMLLPIPLYLVITLYQQGRYHDLMESSYFLQDGSLRQLQLLIVRLPVIPEFHFFRDRYTPLVWERRWNWLNYYDFSVNNFIKLGFNDIRLRDHHLPGLISTLVWYQWSLGLLYIALLLWTLSRTIPGLNLLIYLK